MTLVAGVHQGGPTTPVTSVQLGLREVCEELEVPHTGRRVTVEGGEEVQRDGPLGLTSPEGQTNPEELFLTQTVLHGSNLANQPMQCQVNTLGFHTGLVVSSRE